MFYTILMYATMVANMIGLSNGPNYYAYSTIVPEGKMSVYFGGKRGGNEWKADPTVAMGNITLAQ